MARKSPTEKLKADWLLMAEKWQQMADVAHEPMGVSDDAIGSNEVQTSAPHRVGSR